MGWRAVPIVTGLETPANLAADLAFMPQDIMDIGVYLQTLLAVRVICVLIDVSATLEVNIKVRKRPQRFATPSLTGILERWQCEPA